MRFKRRAYFYSVKLASPRVKGFAQFVALQVRTEFADFGREADLPAAAQGQRSLRADSAPLYQQTACYGEW